MFTVLTTVTKNVTSKNFFKVVEQPKEGWIPKFGESSSMILAFIGTLLLLTIIYMVVKRRRHRH